MGCKVITPPAVEPLTLAEVKSRLQITDVVSDGSITAYIKDARRQAEVFLQRALITQTLEFALDTFPDYIDLPVMPAASITSISYTDTDGNAQTVDAADYALDDYSAQHRIVRAYGVDWPNTYDIPNAIKVRYIAGYGDAGSDVPEDIRTALEIAVGHMVRFKAEAEQGVGPTRMPMQFFDRLSPYRVMRLY